MGCACSSLKSNKYQLKTKEKRIEKLKVGSFIKKSQECETSPDESQDRKNNVNFQQKEQRVDLQEKKEALNLSNDSQKQQKQIFDNKIKSQNSTQLYENSRINYQAHIDGLEITPQLQNQEIINDLKNSKDQQQISFKPGRNYFESELYDSDLIKQTDYTMLTNSSKHTSYSKYYPCSVIDNINQTNKNQNMIYRSGKSKSLKLGTQSHTQSSQHDIITITINDYSQKSSMTLNFSTKRNLQNHIDEQSSENTDDSFMLKKKQEVNDKKNLTQVRSQYYQNNIITAQFQEL